MIEPETPLTRCRCQHARRQMMHDAIVIGAGPANGSTAIALAQHGWSVAMVEKVAFSPKGSKANHINFQPARSTSWRRRDLARGSRPRNTSRQVLFACSAGARIPRARRVSAAPGRDRLDYVLLQAAERGVEILQPCKASLFVGTMICVCDRETDQQRF